MMFRPLNRQRSNLLYAALSGVCIVLLFVSADTVLDIRMAFAARLAPIFAAFSPAPVYAENRTGQDSNTLYFQNLELKARNIRLKETIQRLKEREMGRNTLESIQTDREEAKTGTKNADATQDEKFASAGNPPFSENENSAPHASEKNLRWSRDILENAIPATLIARPVYKARALYILDRGRMDGVQQGAGILCRGIAVGRIVAVSDRASLMAPVTHPACQLPAWILQNQIGGQLQGADNTRGRNAAKLMYVPRRESIQPGEIVSTSGLDGAFPPGILIGTVQGVRRADAAFHDITITAALTADRIREVWILKRRFIPIIHEKQGELDADLSKGPAK